MRLSTAQWKQDFNNSKNVNIMKQTFFMMISLVVFIVVSAQTSALNQKEKDAIIHMREEEKLARDVYNFLFEKWEMNPFGNIRQSEQTHRTG